MRAVVVNETGPAEVLTYVEDHAVPQVGDGQVLVQNEFAGINFIDTYHRGGLYPRELPFIGGQEGGGKIVATTPAAEAQGFAVGDSVVYSVFGSYAEYSVCPCSSCMVARLLCLCRVVGRLCPQTPISSFYPAFSFVWNAPIGCAQRKTHACSRDRSHGRGCNVPGSGAHRPLLDARCSCWTY